jgi:glycosyltransferase involved in cell wall biosynthesis
MPRVSVVIPAYNSEKHLGETLRSALNSSFTDLEVVVVDDGSSDKTADIAAGFGPKVRVLSQANAGMSASRNRGIDSCDSEFIALLDSDDVWHPLKLQYQLQALSGRPEHGFAFTNFSVWDGGSQNGFCEQARTGAVDGDFDGWIYHRLIVTNWALPSSVLFRSRAWRELGPFHCDDHQTDDWEYLVRASRQFRFVRLAEPMVLYRQHASSLSRRLPTQHTGEIMRETLIARYGLASPDGQIVDHDALNHERYLGWSNFADAHCARGKLGTGVRTFGGLMLRGPRRRDAALKMSKALFRRAFPKRG